MRFPRNHVFQIDTKIFKKQVDVNQTQILFYLFSIKIHSLCRRGFFFLDLSFFFTTKKPIDFYTIIRTFIFR